VNQKNKVIHALQRLGRPIYGFDPDTYVHNAAAKKRRIQVAEGGNGYYSD